MVYCVAYGCRNSAGNGASMHRIPHDIRRVQWLRNINRMHWKPTKYSSLCGNHFTEDCFVMKPSLAKILGIKVNKFRLKATAIPTIFEHRPSSKPQNKRSSLYLEKKRKRELHDELMASRFQTECQDVIKAPPQYESPENFESGFTDNIQVNTDSSSSSNFSSVDLEPQGLNEKKDNATQLCPVLQNVSTQCSANGRHFVRNIGCQTLATRFHDQGIQCNLLEASCQCQDEDSGEDSLMETDDESIDSTSDSDYDPFEDSDMSDLEDDDEEILDEKYELNADSNPVKEKKFIVFESCLRALLAICNICFSQCQVLIEAQVGTMIKISRVCPRNHRYSWQSQPTHSSMPQGNLILAASMFFSGCSPTKYLNTLRCSNICHFSLRTYNMIQRYYLVPLIFKSWKTEQNELFSKIKATGKANLAGDARCDSPGYSAKYGSYTLMDLDSSKVIDLQLVQCNETSSSNAMELCGLKRSFELLNQEHVNVQSFTTDRHVGVKKYMREQHPDINHWFDVWHMAKGVYKKLLALGKKKSFILLDKWAKSISNHMYWCATSSDGKAEIILQKWISILNHVGNVHTGHGKDFPDCEHDDLNDRPWILKGSRAHKALEGVIKQKSLLKDLPQLSHSGQTSALEAFHKVLCWFAPKSTHFFYLPMKARLLLAVLHFNENVAREQAYNKKGQAMWGVSYPKYKAGQAVIKPVKIPCTFGYVSKLMESLQELRKEYPSYKKARDIEFEDIVPQSLSSSFDKQSKASLVQQHITRFNHYI